MIWEIKHHKDRDNEYYSVQDGRNRVIVDTLNCDYSFSLEDHEIHAKLVAAAPEMQDALRAAWPWLLWAKERGAICDPTINEVKSALLKAKT